MRKGEFAGTGEVFSFTLRQYLKSKSTIAAMVVMLVVSVVSLFIAGASMSKGVIDRTAVERIVILDETGSGATAEAVRANQPLFGKVEISFDVDDQGGAHTAVVIISREDMALSVTAANGPEGELERYDLSLAAQAVEAAVQEARIASLGLDEEQLQRFTNAVPEVMSAEEYYRSLEPAPEGEKENAVSFDTSYAITLAYAILVIVLVNFSASYIVRSVVEEKASKLVEFLMVSVKPMALILGKILASMCLVAIELVVLAGGLFLSWWISSNVFGVRLLSDITSALGIGTALVNMGPGLIAAIVVSILLAYAVFSLIGALSGVCCSTMEDVQSANGTVVMLVMIGYAVSLVTAGLGGRTASAVLSMLPVVSAFIAPVRYALGQIGFGVLAGSWAVQIVVIALLAAFCRKVYATLLMQRGSRVKMGQLLSIARQAKGGERA